MNKKKIGLIFAVIFPIVCLLGLTVYKAVKLHAGTKIAIPVSGHDPRDILSGHYVIYQVNYNCQNTVCENAVSSHPYYMCVRELPGGKVESEFMHYKDSTPEKGCKVKIEGYCEYKRFKAGIERFYIPEEHASTLDKAVRNNQGKIIVSVDANGVPMVKDLLIDDRPWKELFSSPQGKERSK